MKNQVIILMAFVLIAFATKGQSVNYNNVKTSINNNISPIVYHFSTLKGFTPFITQPLRDSVKYNDAKYLIGDLILDSLGIDGCKYQFLKYLPDDKYLLGKIYKATPVNYIELGHPHSTGFTVASHKK